MRILDRITSLDKSVVTIGAYDGIHLGHQLLLKNTVEAARQSGVPAVVITFEPLPDEVISGARPFLLTLPEEKNEILKRLGIDIAVYLRFNEKMRHLEAEKFLEMIEPLSPVEIVVGEDFRFGRDAVGDISLIKSHFNSAEVITVPLLKRNEVTVKSSLIRKLIVEGRVDDAALYLGRNYSVQGRVIRGRGLGARLGYPTANLRVPSRKLIPGPGVYAARVLLEEKEMNAAVFVPDFGEIEAHVIDRQVDAYGRILRVSFVKKVSEVEIISQTEELKAKISRDILKVKEALSLSY